MSGDYTTTRRTLSSREETREREEQRGLSKRGELKRWGEWSRNEELMIFSETSRRFQTSHLEDAGFALKKV
jgi:hypothetical protein